MSKLALGRSSVYQAENSRKDETKKSYNPPMESNVDAAIPIGYITLSNLLFVFFSSFTHCTL